MRILFLSNFYPPARPGGYTQWCYEVAESLKARGHTIGVLTSRHELGQMAGVEENVWRVLHLEADLLYYRPVHFFTRRRSQHRQNLAYLRQVVAGFQPNVLFVWGMWAMSQALPALAERLLPSRVVYYLSDYWPSAIDMHTQYWRLPARRWLTRLPRQLLSAMALAMLAREGKPHLEFEHVICVSAAVRQNLVEAGIPIRHARIIHGGTQVTRFPNIPPGGGDGQLKLLVAGQLVPHKGIHTAIQAMAHLAHRHKIGSYSLALVGSGQPAYEAHLRALVDRAGLTGQVTFHGRVSREDMPALLQQFHVLVFPSIYAEPLARVTQEAMACGLVVVGTTTGGTQEILVDGQNGLTFAPEDPEGLASQIERLAGDPTLRRRLAEAGRRTVLERFTLDRMVAEIENYLRAVLS